MKPIITVAAVDIRCPKCNEFIAAPSGSLFFTIAEVKSGDKLTCDCCQTVVIVPAFKTVRVE